MLSVSDVFIFQQQKTLEDVNIKFTPGNCYGVIGANGAGKSTFLKILSGNIVKRLQCARTESVFFKQDHFQYNEEIVLNTVIMGNEKLLEVMKEKDAIYAKPDFSDEDGVRAAELSLLLPK